MSQANNKILLIAFLVAALIQDYSWANGESPLIIDVRSADEWQAGHLESATHLQLDNVAEGIERLVEDKHQAIYLYCRSGNRSGKALKILEGLGYSNVINAGGIADASGLFNQQIITD